MLKFEEIEFWGDPEEFAVNPPVIVIEIFDMDKELIGSVSKLRQNRRFSALQACFESDLYYK